MVAKFPTKGSLASYCHGGFTIVRGKYLVKGGLDKKGNRGVGGGGGTREKVEKV